MSVAVVVKEEFNNLGVIADRLGPDAYNVISEGARRITERARELVPEDTGALKASIYIVNEKGTNYNFALYASTDKIENSYKGGFSEEPMEPVGYRAGKMTIIISAAAPYAGYVEYGHFARDGVTWVPAQPFLEPAFEEILPSIYDDLYGMFNNYGAL